jgi:prolyl oligopeptidase
MPSSPPTRRDDTTDVLHGTPVADPYRWLEDGDATEVQEWVAAQNARTRALLDARPDRADWHRRLVELLSLPVVAGARVRGDRLFVEERPSGSEQLVLTLRSASDRSLEPIVLVDPAAGSSDATTAIDWYAPSPDGTLVAYGTSEGGTENSTLRVLSVDDRTHLADEIPHTRACSVAWEPDGRGFHYTRYPDGDEYHRTVHMHRIGDDWHDDPVVWADHVTPETWPDVDVSRDGRWVLVTAMVGWSRYDLHLLDRTTMTWREIVTGREATTQLVFDADSLVGTTTLDAPKGRLVRVMLDEPTPEHWITLVPERDVVLTSATVNGDEILVAATRNAVDSVERYTGDGELVGEVALGVVSVAAIAAGHTGGPAFVCTGGFDAPNTLWRVAGGVAERWCPGPPPISALPALVVRQVTYPSLDGTEIGLFLVHREDVEPSPQTPTIVTGYGGFAIAETPAWSPSMAAWCAAGGVYGIAGLRGGLEHGEAWHQAGRRATKQNVFDDFAAAADWMVSTGRASRERLAIAGGSNGGLLVGATLTQRPDVCRAVWCAVPLLDMIRFPQFLIARLWTDEYGDPDVAEDFAWLHAYSPYHHVRHGGCYPAVLLTTAEGDSRVDPLHARKMAAMLQWAQGCADERPILLHQEGRAGHGVGKPVGKRADEGADVLSFIAWQLGVS